MASSAIDIQSIYAELVDSNYTIIQLKQAVALSSGVLEFKGLTPGRSYIVKLAAVYTDDNMTFREEYPEITDITAPVINQFTT